MENHFYMCDEWGFVQIVEGSSLAYNQEGEVELKHKEDEMEEDENKDELQEPL